MVLHAHLSAGMNNRFVGGRSSETLSHPFDIIIIIIINISSVQVFWPKVCAFGHQS
jgi:hypothetical protein